MSDENQSVRSLSRGLAHRFNNTLTGISDLELAIDEQDPERRRVIIVNAMKSADRMAGLIRQLLDFSRAGDITEPHEFFLSGIATKLREEFASGSGISIDLPKIRFNGNEMKILLMLRLLVRRSAEALEGREGRIDVGGNITMKEVSGRQADFLVLMVSDNGPAIPESALPHVFEPFFNPHGRPEAGDLKLATVDAIASAHGGWAECISGSSAGVIISVYLPIARLKPAAGPENRIG